MRIDGLASFSNAKCSLHRSLLIRRTFYAFHVTPIDIYSRVDGALAGLLARHLKSCDSVDCRGGRGDCR
jgi:hypothetical protein